MYTFETTLVMENKKSGNVSGFCNKYFMTCQTDSLKNGTDVVKNEMICDSDVMRESEINLGCHY